MALNPGGDGERKFPLIGDRPCDTCGEPATCAVRDMQQTGAVDGWPTFEPDGDWHFYCEEHKREPVTAWLEDDA